MIRHLSRPNGVNHKNESGRSTPRSSSPAVEIELAPPSRLHPVTAIDRQSPSTSVTCTYIPKVQHRSPGQLASKALEKSDLAGSSHPANIPRTPPSVDVAQRAANAMTCPNGSR